MLSKKGKKGFIPPLRKDNESQLSFTQSQDSYGYDISFFSGTRAPTDSLSTDKKHKDQDPLEPEKVTNISIDSLEISIEDDDSFANLGEHSITVSPGPYYII